MCCARLRLLSACVVDHISEREDLAALRGSVEENSRSLSRGCHVSVKGFLCVSVLYFVPSASTLYSLPTQASSCSQPAGMDIRKSKSARDFSFGLGMRTAITSCKLPTLQILFWINTEKMKIRVGRRGKNLASRMPLPVPPVRQGARPNTSYLPQPAKGSRDTLVISS